MGRTQNQGNHGEREKPILMSASLNISNMTVDQKEKQLLLIAKKQVHRIKIFYIHLALYIIVVGLIALNFYVMVEGPYTDNIRALNIIGLMDLSNFNSWMARF